MDFRHALGFAIRAIRKSRKLSQEQFDVVSSRTYISVLERGIKGATLEKLDQISGVLGVHPAALVCVAYALADGKGSPGLVIEEISSEAKALLEQMPGSCEVPPT